MGVEGVQGAQRHPTAQALVDAAVEQMDETGEAAIHIKSVLEASGVAYGSLYHHFRDREDLVCEAIAERYVRSVRLGLTAFAEQAMVVTTPAEVRDLLRSEMARLDDATLRLQRRRRLNAFGSAMFRPEVLDRIAAAQATYFHRAGSILAVLQERGLIHPSIDVRSFAAWYLSLVLSRAFVEIDPAGDVTGSWSDYTFEATIVLLEQGVPEGHPIGTT